MFRRLLVGYAVTDFSEEEREELTLAWQRLIPWPDVVPGLIRLKERFTLVTLSNADVCAVVNISKRAGLPWDAIFTAEMAGVFKPAAEIYRMAATYLGLTPAEIMMVASHKYDIRAAAALGFQTAFVARPLEFGTGGTPDVAYDGEFDINAANFLDLADQLDARCSGPFSTDQSPRKPPNEKGFDHACFSNPKIMVTRMGFTPLG